ncbi:MAG: hypothetical protein DRJ61_09250 [Acidobacteria bacterium]|nr:MAG: hypothetical protein DRJ61_09250 [Acidobacteriota bacterium]
MSRGIVLPPHFTVLKSRDGYGRFDGLNPEDLRKAILYWDRVDIPQSILGARDREFENQEELRLLEAEGVLSRTQAHLIELKGDQSLLSMDIMRPLEFWMLAQLFGCQKYLDQGGELASA